MPPKATPVFWARSLNDIFSAVSNDVSFRSRAVVTTMWMACLAFSWSANGAVVAHLVTAVRMVLAVALSSGPSLSLESIA